MCGQDCLKRLNKGDTDIPSAKSFDQGAARPGSASAHRGPQGAGAQTSGHAATEMCWSWWSGRFGRWQVIFLRSMWSPTDSYFNSCNSLLFDRRLEAKIGHENHSGERSSNPPNWHLYFFQRRTWPILKSRRKSCWDERRRGRSPPPRTPVWKAANNQAKTTNCYIF